MCNYTVHTVSIQFIKNYRPKYCIFCMTFTSTFQAGKVCCIPITVQGHCPPYPGKSSHGPPLLRPLSEGSLQAVSESYA